MASNILLAGELARRNKDIGPGCDEAINHNLFTDNTNGTETNISPKNNEGNPDWKMALYHQSSEQQAKQKQLNIIDSYNKTQTFSLAPENAVGIDTISGSGLQREVVDDSSKMGTHLSNASSLVTSLSSSRECSPDRSSLPMAFGMPPPPAAAAASAKLFTTGSANAVNSWIPSSQLRPALTMPHMPVFAAWTDA